MNRTLLGIVALLAMAASVLAACGDSDDAGRQGINVVATTSILGDIVSNVVGDEATVTVIMPRGADPHDFRPSSAQAAEISGADLVVANGLGLEEGLLDVLDAASLDGVRVLEVAPELDPIEFAAGHEHHDDETDHDDEGEHDEDGHDDEGGGLDPHFWFDPLRVADAAGLVAAELTAIAPDGGWQARAGAYAGEMRQLDGQIEGLLDPVPSGSRAFVTNHDSLGYFADRYDFEVIGAVLPGGTTVGDPSSADLTDLVGIMRDEGVTVIFSDSTVSDRLAQTVAAELGSEVSVVELTTGSLGEPGSDSDTVAGLLLTNARLMSDALSQ